MEKLLENLNMILQFRSAHSQLFNFIAIESPLTFIFENKKRTLERARAISDLSR